MTLQIVEILSPSEQGLARPYKCPADDGKIYFVKGRQTTRACLWHEWICAHLAQRFGLQVPPFEIVEVCQELLDEAPPAWRDLGVGPAFGSRLHTISVWLEVSALHRVPPQVQRDVLVFDWWVRNGDRQVGNPNLLWDVSAAELVVIDHNQAFDRNFSASDFMANHVFAAHWHAITADLVLQAEYAERLSDALLAFPTGCDNVPTEWYWANAEMDVPATFDLDRVKNILGHCATPELWRTV